MNGTDTDRITNILDSCRDDAKEQLAVLKAMIDNSDRRDIQAMAVMVLAAENTAKTVQKMCFLSINGGDHGLARSAA